MRFINIDPKLRDSILKQILEEVTKDVLSSFNGPRGSTEIKINKKFDGTFKADTNAVINFSAIAWLKMRTLINDSKEECAWHGVVDTDEDRKYFYIRDILVYPQRINGMYVEDDDPLYEVWHQSLDTPTYNHLRMQGHSHVNAQASPSGRDNETFNNMLQALSTTDYYIFMIANKQGNMWFNIYDLKNNLIWENTDVDILIEGMDFYGWYKDMEKTFFAARKYVTGGSSTTGTTVTSNRGATFQSEPKTLEELRAEKEQNTKVSEPYNLTGQASIEEFFSGAIYGGVLNKDYIIVDGEAVKI